MDSKAMDEVVITTSPLDIAAISNSVTAPCTGATSLFVGTTRDNFQGKKVVRLEYEAYEPMAKKEMVKLCADLRSKWTLHNITIHHRLGLVQVTEASVVIAVSSPHRKESLEVFCVQVFIFCYHVFITGCPVCNRQAEGNCSYMEEGSL